MVDESEANVVKCKVIPYKSNTYSWKKLHIRLFASRDDWTCNSLQFVLDSENLTSHHAEAV